MTYQVDLPEEVYQQLQRAAKKEGLILAEWIASTVSRVSTPVLANEDESAFDALAEYIGAIDSRDHKADPKYRSEVGDLIDENLRKQGLTLPEWER